MNAKITREDHWFIIVDQEEGEALATLLVEDILKRAQEVVFEKHIESQVLPYAVNFAKDCILSIIELEFFRRDPGIINPETWKPDKEPPMILTDVLARGVIPLREVASKQRVATGATMADSKVSSAQSNPSSFLSPAGGTLLTPEKILLNSFQNASSSPNAAGIPPNVSSLPLGAESLTNTLSTHKSNALSPSRASSRSVRHSKKASVLGSKSSVSTRDKTAKGSNPSTGRLASTAVTAGDSEVVGAQDALEKTIQEENKKVLQRVITNAEKDTGKLAFNYNSDGRVVIVKKPAVNPLITHGIRAKICDLEEPPTPGRKKSKGKHGSILTVDNTAKGSTFMPHRESDYAASEVPNAFKEDHSLDIPSLMETMRLAPGVTLREGDLVKRGPLVEIEDTKKQKKIIPKLDDLRIPLSPDTSDKASFLDSIIQGIHPVIQLKGEENIQ